MCLPVSHDELPRLWRCCSTPSGLCAMITHTQVCREQQSVCVLVPCGYWLSVHCLAYLFTHSAMDRPVDVEKGREEIRSLLFVETWSSYLITRYLPDFDRLFLWALLRAAGPFEWPAPAPSGSIWHYKPSLAAPGALPTHRPLYVIIDLLICYHWLVRITSSISMKWSNYHSQIRRGQW